MYIQRVIAEAILRRSVEVMAEIRNAVATPVSEKTKALQDFFSKSPFGCHNPQAILLVEILTGEKINQVGTSEHPRKWSVVVVTTDKNTYLNEGTTGVVVGTSGGTFTIERCDLSPADSSIKAAHCRLATPEEEAAFREKMKLPENFDKLVGYISKFQKTESFFAS